MPSTHILRCVHSKNRTCFLGVNPLTFNRSNRNTTDFQVSIVRVNIEENRALYFSTCVDYTLKEGQFSLNGFFAMKIGFEQDRFYEIIEQTESIPCESITFAPVSVDDWDILQNNTEMTEDVFLHQIRILSLDLIFPIWISGLCILLRVVELEPKTFAVVISSSTRVTVIPEYRPSVSAPSSSSSSITTTSIDESSSSRPLLRSIGSLVCSSLSDGTKKHLPSVTKTCQLTLIPGRHRRVFRLEIDPMHGHSSHPTMIRLNRSDWSDNIDETHWPSQFVVKTTIYRSKGDSQPKIFFLLVQLVADRPIRKRHVLVSSEFARLNQLRSTDRCVIANWTRRPIDSFQLELITSTWNGPNLLVQHYFHQWIRSYSSVDQPILLSDGFIFELDGNRYVLRLDSNSSYVALNDENIGQYSIIVTEKKDVDTNDVPLIIEEYLSESSAKLEVKHTERLLSILDVQFQSSLSSEYLFKNVIVTGRRGCGKKTIVGQCLQQLWKQQLIFYKFIDCLSFKGRKLENIINSLTQVIDEIVFRQPSILILDHFDELFPNETSITDANIILATQKLSLSVKELILRVQKIHRETIFIAIARDITSIHRQFTEEIPLFSSQILTIEPLNSIERISIVEDILRQKHQTFDNPELLQTIINRTESFVIKDLQTLIDNALLHLWMSFEDRALSQVDFDYAFDEFKPINVKLLDDDPKKTQRTMTRWSDIGGMETIKQELIQTVQWRFEHSNYFSHAPIRLVSGVLLYGPSGCGKTLLAQTLANECQVNFIQVKGPELLNKYVGSSEQNIRDLFTRARSVTPCIVLFDEFEALVPRRGRDSAGVTDRVVNQLLTELDGVESLGDIVVIAATSRPDLIDPALLRPGRLDKHFYIGFPSQIDIELILKLWTRKIHLADDVDFNDETLMEYCRWYTGADLKAFVYNAQLAAFDEYGSKDALVVHQRHFLAAREQTAYSIPEKMRKSLEQFYSNWKKPIAIDDQRVSLA